MMSFQRSHVIFSVFLEICFLACWNDAKISGVFSPPQTLPVVLASFSINARPNQLIAVQVFVFDAAEEGRHMMAIYDKKRGKEKYVKHLYHKRGEDIIHTRNDASDEEIVTLPFTFNSTTNKIMVNYVNLNLTNRGFVARYEKYPNNLCTKSSLIEDTTQLTCTRYSIAPTADRCNYYKDCPAHFVTWGRAKCDIGTRVWHDTTTCIADPIRAKQCEFVDLGDYAVVTDCIYSLSDIIRYYKTMHRSFKWTNFKFSAGRGAVIDFLQECNMCRKKKMLLRHTSEKNCYYWLALSKFPLCVHCRFIFHCTSHRNTMPYIGQGR